MNNTKTNMMMVPHSQALQQSHSVFLCRGFPISSNLLNFLLFFTASAFAFVSVCGKSWNPCLLLHLPNFAKRFFYFCASALIRIRTLFLNLSFSFFLFPLLGFFFSLLLLGMGNWRKQHGEGHHQVGHWSRSSSSYNRKPALEIWWPTVPRWEKMFCALVGSVPWRKLVETKNYMYLHDNVMNWDDSAGREAFDNAKRRFWAVINGLPCDISLPDPNIYIDDIDWNSSVDPALLLDLEREAKVPSDEEKDKEVVILDSSFLLNQSFSCTGWGEAEADTSKHTDLFSGAQVNLHENNRVGPWEQYCAPDEAAKEYEWQNCRDDSWGWNQREHYQSDAYIMGKGGAGWNRRTWYGYNRKEENMSWKTPAYHHGDEYQMSRGRRNNRGRKRGNFAYRPCVMCNTPIF